MISDIHCTQDFLDDLILRYPQLAPCRESIQNAYLLIARCYHNQSKLLLCGNGGSAADCEHIVGELMKGFLSGRALRRDDFAGREGREAQTDHLLAHLQGALPAISLCSPPALITAIENDLGGDFTFAQQIMGLGASGDCLLGISTSGNASNVCLAMAAGRLRDMNLIGLTGKDGGQLRELCDVCICVDAASTYQVQELHLPVYHCLCAMLEHSFFEERGSYE